MIQARSKSNEVSLWETLVDYCDETGMEHTVAASLLSKPLREEIKIEVQELNLLKGNGKRAARLPV